jgi:hypothetical protein
MVLSGTSDDCRSDLFEVRACRSHRDNLPFPGVGISIVRERGGGRVLTTQMLQKVSDFEVRHLDNLPFPGLLR